MIAVLTAAGITFVLKLGKIANLLFFEPPNGFEIALEYALGHCPDEEPAVIQFNDVTAAFGHDCRSAWTPLDPLEPKNLNGVERSLASNTNAEQQSVYVGRDPVWRFTLAKPCRQSQPENLCGIRRMLTAFAQEACFISF